MLDDKLREILWSYEDNLHLQELVDEAAEKIKQAFADEGYVLDVPKITDATTYPLVWAKANGYKTGQEWLTRLEKELAGERLESFATSGTTLYYPKDEVLEAAKKASGL